MSVCILKLRKYDNHNRLEKTKNGNMSRTKIKHNTIEPKITTTITEIHKNFKNFLEHSIIGYFREKFCIDLDGSNFVSKYMFSLVLPCFIIN